MLVAVFGLTTAVAWLLTPVAVRAAWMTGWLDHPEARKLHTSATALLGGVVVFLATIAGVAIVLRVAPHAAGLIGRRGLLVVAGATVALVWGLWDDRRGMGVPLKLTGQLLAASLLLAAGTVPDLGLPVWLEVAIALFGLVSLMNAINFLDNMNGMVGGIVGLTLVFHALHAMRSGLWGLAAMQLAVAGACAGFLPFNFPRARIFLGDAGSLLLGYSLGAS
ncbi:MAG: glycosyltransferase family 4 protein, partial [Candidatus Eisenbacteria bacterium]